MLALDKNKDTDIYLLLETIIGTSPDLMYIKDVNSNFLLANSAVAEVMGVGTPDHLIGKNDTDFYGEHVAEKYLKDERHVIKTGKSLLNIEEECYLPNQSVKWLSTSKFPYLNKEGEIVGIIGLGRDITDSKNYRDEIHNQAIQIAHESGKAELATNVLHNVGNVLNSINVSVSEQVRHLGDSKLSNLSKAVDLLLANKQDLNHFIATNNKGKVLLEYLSKLAHQLEDEQENLRTETKAITEKLEVIKNILEIQQSYAQSLDLLDTVNFYKVVESAYAIQRKNLESQFIKFNNKIPNNLEIRANKSKVIHVFINLIKNAAEAMELTPVERRAINIEAKNNGNEIIIAVSDKGVGLSAQQMKEIFNHGYTTKEKGNGFGLHSCAITMMESNGKISVASEGAGKGSTFELTFSKEEL